MKPGKAFKWLSGLLIFGLLCTLSFRELVKARCYAFVGPIICRVETQDRKVALTFDDGPSRRGLDAVLPLLSEYDATATFFLIGQDVKSNPGLAAQIAAAGHEIGSHSYTHPRMFGLDRAAYETELRRTDAALEAEGIAKPCWFRPPNGVKFVGLGRAVEANGQTMVMWDVEEPSSKDGVEAYAEALLAQVRPGSIILIHPMVQSRLVEREALPIILEGLARQGYEIVSVGELVASR